MDRLPNDLPMLVSAINFLLRDKEFDNLDQICFAFSKDRIELEQRLAKAGYHYDAQDKRFWKSKIIIDKNKQRGCY